MGCQGGAGADGWARGNEFRRLGRVQARRPGAGIEKFCASAAVALRTLRPSLGLRPAACPVSGAPRARSPGALPGRAGRRPGRQAAAPSPRTLWRTSRLAAGPHGRESTARAPRGPASTATRHNLGVRPFPLPIAPTGSPAAHSAHAPGGAGCDAASGAWARRSLLPTEPHGDDPADRPDSFHCPPRRPRRAYGARHAPLAQRVNSTSSPSGRTNGVNE
jgi:hypothetical protein